MSHWAMREMESFSYKREEGLKDIHFILCDFNILMNIGLILPKLGNCKG